MFLRNNASLLFFNANIVVNAEWETIEIIHSERVICKINYQKIFPVCFLRGKKRR